MSARFPQEIFDYIIDYGNEASRIDEVAQNFSTVCKRWALRCRPYIFEDLYLSHQVYIDKWCENIPPTIDGPSKYVQHVSLDSGVGPLVSEPQPSEPYLDHFSALTNVTTVKLAGHRGPVHMDTFFRGFSAFKNSLRALGISSNLRFEDLSRIMEFFPNLDKLNVYPLLRPRRGEECPFQPPRRASFPNLRFLTLHSFSEFPELGDDLLFGLAEASMPILEILIIIGTVPNLGGMQKLVDSSAQSLIIIYMDPLGESYSHRHTCAILMIDPSSSPVELDLSACDNLMYVGIYKGLYTGLLGPYLYDPLNKHKFEHALSTIKSPKLCAITVQIHIKPAREEWEEEITERHDWTHLDALLCGILLRVRERVKDPSWRFMMRITGSDQLIDGLTGGPLGADPPTSDQFLPQFQEMGGVVELDPDWD